MIFRTGRSVSAALSILLCTASIAALTSAAARAQPAAGPPDGPRFIDRKDGEPDKVRAREEWFYAPRRAGTSSDREMAARRRVGVEQTRAALSLQRQRQASGFEAEQNFWAEKGPSPSTFGGWAFGTISGRIQAIAADWAGSTLYVGAASGGVWKSTNDGLSWNSIFDTAGTLAIGAIEIDPGDPDVLWVGTGDNIVGCESYFGIGLLRSTDGGQSWEPRNGGDAATLDDLSSFAGVSVDPRDSSRLVVGGRYRGCSAGSQQAGGIYTTLDAGQTWTARLSNVEVHELARDPQQPDTLWAAANGGVYKSVDNGVNWTHQSTHGLPSGSGRTELAVAPSAPDTVYVLFSSPANQFWRTTDGGDSWSLMNSNACDGQCFYNMVLRVHSSDPDIVYRGTVRIFKSENGGSSWTTLTNSWGGSQQVHQDTQSMLVHPSVGETFYVGSDGGLWKSENGGSSFQNLNGNLNVTQFYAVGVDAADPERICGGAQDNSSLARDGDNVWAVQAVTGDGFVCQIDPVDPNRAYITSYPSGGFPNVWRSQNGLYGNFTDITGAGSGVVGGDRIAWVTPYTVDPTAPNVLYLGTHRVYRSDDFGSSWTQVGAADLTHGGGAVLLVVEVNRNFPAYVYSGASSGAVYFSSNSGSDWTDISSGLPTRAVNDVAPDPTNPERAFAVVSGFGTAHLWEWNLAGGWTARGGGLPDVPANSVLMLTDQDIVVGTDTGVFRSTDGGENFLPFMAGLPQGMVVTDLKYNEAQSVITAGTYGRGAWQVEVGAIQPILIAESVEQPLLEVDGDGDAQIEPGETWSVRPILRNVGGLTAVAVRARLESTTAGIQLLTGAGGFGDLDPGIASPSQAAFEFTVAPEFECGGALTFDLVEIASDTPPSNYPDRNGIFTATVQGGNAEPIVTAVVNENFEGAVNWPHQAVDPALPNCDSVPYIDEWNLVSKDAGHGISYHAGGGPGASYARGSYSWLHPLGRDSTGGVGLEIPAEAIGATVSLVHWYDTADGKDGGQLAIDSQQDGSDLYVSLNPVGGYPSALDSGFCNGLEGKQAFSGNSTGWITSQFDLTPFRGQRVWLAFVFGSDRKLDPNEGWYIDDVMIGYQLQGAATCDIARWPGQVPQAQFRMVAGGLIEAVWDDACNLAQFPEQSYSVQAGDLASLRGGSYSHVPVADDCDRQSGTQFVPGSGSEYYLIVPRGDGREGGAGSNSAGAARPQMTSICGTSRNDCE